MTHPILLRYQPPTLPVNYTTFTVNCKSLPPDTPQPDLLKECTKNAPCLFDVIQDPCELHNVAKENPAVVQALRTRLAHYKTTAVLPWVNFHVPEDPRAAPGKHGPTVPITPNPPVPGPLQGPDHYEGVWSPWLTLAEEAFFYPSNYSGPGYPTSN